MIIKLNTENIRKYARIISQAYVKGSQFSESVYIDIENEYLYFSNTFYSGRVKINLEKSNDNENEDKIENFFVEIPSFLTLMCTYDELLIKKDKDSSGYVFVNGKEKFKPVIFKKPDSYEVISFEGISNSTQWSELLLTEKVVEDVLAATGYASSDKKPEFNGISIKNGIISATDSCRLFISNSNSNINEQISSYSDINLVLDSISFIREGFKLSKGNVCIYHNSAVKTYCVVINGGEVEIIFSESIALSIPDLKDEALKEKFEYEEYIVVEKAQLEQILLFFEAFVKNERNEKLYINVSTESELQIEAIGNMVGNRILPIKSVSSSKVVGFNFWIARYFLLQAIMAIKDDYIKVYFNEKGPAVNVTGETNLSRKIYIVKLIV